MPTLLTGMFAWRKSSRTAGGSSTANAAELMKTMQLEQINFMN
jgi:hypothetical protein